MMRTLVLIHRWLGIAFCLLFAMWFATGIVMHFVPFPALTETERMAALLAIDGSRMQHGPAEAVVASDIRGVTRVRLVERVDGAIYLVTGRSGVRALHAADLADATVASEPLALSIATQHARQRGLDVSDASVAGSQFYDQWTVPNGFDRHRPLYRIALHDTATTELYVSSVTGEVVLDTTRFERWFGYAGSVAHWIYPTALRSHWAAWDTTVWWLSLATLVAALSGALLGVLRVKSLRWHSRSWHAWHHALGLVSMTFLLTWMFSGWLSMDHGRLFSRGQVSDVEAIAVTGLPDWQQLPRDEARRINVGTKEVEWFGLDGRLYRRERTALLRQMLTAVAPPPAIALPPAEFLGVDEVRRIASHLAVGCATPVSLAAKDDYPVVSVMPQAPVYRVVCGDVWFHVDGASGELLERLDSSRRTYRWLYTALHTLNFPELTAHPAWRSALIVALCAFGLMFSLTGVVIGWRRLTLRI